VPQTLLGHDQLLLCDTPDHKVAYVPRDKAFRASENQIGSCMRACMLAQESSIADKAWCVHAQHSVSQLYNASHIFSTRQKCSNPFTPICRLSYFKIAPAMHDSPLRAAWTPQFNDFLSNPHAWVLCLQSSLVRARKLPFQVSPAPIQEGLVISDEHRRGRRHLLVSKGWRRQGH